MAEYVFVGRHRHPWRIVLYQLLTLGIYGRVYLYKILRELDGHEVLMMDRRPYLFLLILPFIGPWFVKRRVAYLLGDGLRHDETSQPYRRGRMVAWAWLPLAPVFHVKVQGFLNHHWKMHSKAEELALKQEQLANLKKRARSPEAQAEVRRLEKEVVQRAKELEDLRRAALAVREAEALRRQAEADSKKAGIRKSRLASIKALIPAAKLRLPRRAAKEASDEEVPVKEEPVEGAEPEPVPQRRKKEPEDALPPADESAADAPSEPKKVGLFGFLRRPKTAGDEAPKGKSAKGRKSEPQDNPRERRRLAKAERKAKKAAAKEAAKAAKVQAKEDKQKAKEQAKADKQQAKAKARAAKEKAKELRKKEKSKPKASKKASQSPGKKAARGKAR